MLGEYRTDEFIRFTKCNLNFCRHYLPLFSTPDYSKKAEGDKPILVTLFSPQTEEFLKHFTSQHKFNVIQSGLASRAGNTLTVVDAPTMTKEVADSLRQ